MNVLYLLMVVYKGYIEGLCGFMDNNVINDFVGLDGMVYKDVV